tara:strand:+ start:5479 stop:5874 length:396 start_codon:yes stop_codon:yes gene_type:complete
MIDFIFQGAIDERFSDWDTAREFVEQTIVNNPRLDGETKVRLQAIEQDAYDVHANKFLLSEKEEIARYYTYLKNQFPSATSDERFLAIYDAAANVKADESSVGLDDFQVPGRVKVGALVVLGIGAFFLLRD